MGAAEPDVSSEVQRIAFDKTTAVLGAERARQLLTRLMTQHEIELRTPQDLLRLSEVMIALGGFEGAVGAMLGVAAVIRGAGRR